jgi:hypothetical protein
MNTALRVSHCGSAVLACPLAASAPPAPIRPIAAKTLPAHGRATCVENRAAIIAQTAICAV